MYINALMLGCECHQPDGIAVYLDANALTEELTSEYGEEWAASALECAEEICIHEDVDLGNGYFGSRGDLAAATEHNLIDDEGFFGPFAYRDLDGVIHVGDCDNHEQFNSVGEAAEYCRGALLAGETLKRARRARQTDPNGGDAAEYYWHCDATSQLAALEGL